MASVESSGPDGSRTAYLGAPHAAANDGKSLTSLILGKEEKVRDFAVCCHYGASLNVRQDDRSYHYFLEGCGKSREGSKLTKEELELYNLREDPAEQNNVITNEPDRPNGLDRLLRELTQQLIDREQKLLA